LNQIQIINFLRDVNDIPWEYRKDVKLFEYDEYNYAQCEYKYIAKRTNKHGQITKFTRVGKGPCTR